MELVNEKHEAFAKALASGTLQGKAYTDVGYNHNPSAASRLANDPKVQKRVRALKKEISTEMALVMKAPTEEGFNNLSDLGLSKRWVALAYKTIYTDATAAGQYAPANAALGAIQKMLDVEDNKLPEGVSNEDKISVKDTLALLTKMDDITARRMDPNIIDVTPDDYVDPLKVLGMGPKE